MFVRPAATGTPDNDEVVTGSRFPLHEAPSNNQFGSILHVGEPVSKQNEELKEYYQHVRSRMQPMPQTDAKDAQYGFGFGRVIGLMVSAGLLASIGIAAQIIMMLSQDRGFLCMKHLLTFWSVPLCTWGKPY